MKTQYLVSLCCSMDGVPTRLFDTEEEVLDFCRAHFPAGPLDDLDRCPPDHPVYGAAHVYDQDFTCVLGWEVFKFEDGVPVKRFILFDDAPEDAHDTVVTAEGQIVAIPESLS